MEERNESGFDDIRKQFSMLNNVVGQGECEEHNKTYDLIGTPAGTVGSCPDCFKARIKKEDETSIKQALENRGGWQIPYIERFEHVPSDLVDAKVRTYQVADETQGEAKKLAIKYIKSFDKERSLVLSGKPGIGKSHLAYAITKALRGQGHKALFIKTTELLALFKSTYSNGAQLTEERIFEVLRTIDLLVLDDVGREYVKTNGSDSENWATDMLFRTFDARLNKSLICTTNYTEYELEQKYGNNGEPILSRMLQNADALRVEGVDQRRKEKF